jgi:hypothetical protein
MTTPRDPDTLLAAYLEDGMTVLPDRIVDSVLDEVHRTPQRSLPRRWWSPSVVRAVLSTAAVVALIVVGGALLYERGKLDVAAPSPTAPDSGNPTDPAVITATPTPTAEILSLDLTWTEVPMDVDNFPTATGGVDWLGDRFVLSDDNGAISTSLDGLTWTALQPGDPDPGYADLLWSYASVVSWEDTIVGWWNPEEGPDIAGKPPITGRDIVRIVRPGAEPIDTTPFEGRIESIGIGPMGIVAHVHSNVDTDAWVTEKLGLGTNNDWTCCVTDFSFQNGVLQMTRSNGPGLNVVWADEGFLPGDYQDRGFGWFSPDGVEWTAIPSDTPPSLDRGDLPAFPTGMGEVVGVSDGFIARGVVPEEGCALPDGCGGMWHSSDGLTWRNLGRADSEPESWNPRLVPWKGGALMTDGVGSFGFWTSDGYSELPMDADFPPLPGETDPSRTPFATGPLGLVSVRLDSLEVLVTRDGVEWKVQPLPAAMTPQNRLGPTIAVGERSVLYLMWSGESGRGEPYVPSLWVVSFEP